MTTDPHLESDCAWLEASKPYPPHGLSQEAHNARIGRLLARLKPVPVIAHFGPGEDAMIESCYASSAAGEREDDGSEKLRYWDGKHADGLPDDNPRLKPVGGEGGEAQTFDYSKARVIDHREPIEHELKTWTVPYRAVEDGRKPFEFRKYDRDFREGDTLWLRETTVGGAEYTDRELRRKITYILLGGQFGVPLGYAILGLAPAAASPVGTREDERLSPDAAWQQLLEVDDRTSPAEYPDHCLITKDELAFFMSQAPSSSVPVEGWRGIESAPKPKWGEPRQPVLLAWTYRNTPPASGEAYWHEDEDGNGDWWWANTGPNDYFSDTILNSITGQITAWRAVPEPPSPIKGEK